MVAKRIIPCLDVKGGQVVKGINFEGLREVGDAVEMGVRYSEEGADELVYLDISASKEDRSTFTELVERIALGINIPFTVGGGISSLDDAARLLDRGADKISVNSAAIASPRLISDIADRYGSQFDKYYPSADRDALCFDINHFHVLNERFGIAKGDEILKCIARRLQSAFPDTGSFVCRKAADTFLVYCPHKDNYSDIVEQVSAVIEDLETAVKVRVGVYSFCDKKLDYFFNK